MSGGGVGLAGEQLELGEHRDRASAFVRLLRTDQSLKGTARAGSVARRERQLGVEQRRYRARRCGRALERFGEATAADRDLDPQRGELARAIRLERTSIGDLAVRARATAAIAERVEQRFELACTTRAGGELAELQQHVGGLLALAGGEPVPHDLAHARDLIHRAERAVVAGLPGEARALRHRCGARDQLGGCGRQLLANLGRDLSEHVDAHDLVEHDAAIADGIDELMRDQARESGFDIDLRCERGHCGRRDCLTEHGEHFDRGPRRLVERRNLPCLRAKPSARILATQRERHTTRAAKRGIESFDRAELFFEARPQRARRFDVEAVELELGDRRANRRRQRIAADDDDAAERRRSEQ